MIKINIYQLVKNKKDNFDTLMKDFIKMSSKYAKIDIINLFNNKIANAQVLGKIESQKIYKQIYELKMNNGYNIALDETGKSMNSFVFSEALKNKININFFIGGAYGFDKEFLKQFDMVVSLSDLTFAHKIASLVLTEQIFRGLCIINNHPYHKD